MNTEASVFVQKPDADSEKPAQRQKQKQTVVSVHREHRDACTNRVKPRNGGEVLLAKLHTQNFTLCSG